MERSANYNVTYKIPEKEKATRYPIEKISFPTLLLIMIPLGIMLGIYLWSGLFSL